MNRKPGIYSFALVALLLIAGCRKNDLVSPQEETRKKATPATTATAAAGNVTYYLVKAGNPTPEQANAYQLIEAAMNEAVDYMNTYTSFTKSITVYYEPSVPTADGNINGTIRFGSNTYYMNTATALHEIAHTVGVGTTSYWRNVLIVNGIYTGVNATQVLRNISGDPAAEIHGDSQHFWPYGLNYPSEATSPEDYVNHCLILEGMKQDGL
ncbi:hypothetical protein [Chitinophaga japonensis]|uniref:Uncharacterized protein n=1 Tax=Chitinophaga japonensis TaxID=104662 RepID=A0A562TF76_CHIJA|nr:hypothetical protein [Chitinophaga japonensis]TWI91630.1 hypothetical protein LX66_1005 [Chitinophaga japonensis]